MSLRRHSPISLIIGLFIIGFFLDQCHSSPSKSRIIDDDEEAIEADIDADSESIVPPSTCFRDACSSPETDNFFSYAACCDNRCCTKLRYWVYPASIASVGFVAGAFFALCFQCR